MLQLTANTYTIPAQYSNNIQIQFEQDNTNFNGWIPTVQAGLYDSSVIECADALQGSVVPIDSSGIITLNNNILSQSGFLVLSITLTSGDENVVLPAIVYQVTASTGQINILPPDTEAWQQVVEAFAQGLFNNYTTSTVQPVLTQAQQAVHSANQTNETINTSIENGDFIPQISATVATGEAGSQAQVTQTGTKQAPVLNFTIPQGIQGVQGPQGIQGIQGPAGPSTVQVNGQTQDIIDLKGALFFISQDDSSVTLGSFEEWVEAGSPAAPIE